MPPARILLSKREFVYQTLRDQISDGTREPGDRLVIDDLASELGVSPIPIREALQQLQSDGFVTIEPYIGACVAEIHAESITEVFALLEMLECISGQSACLRMTGADFDRVEALLGEMDGHLDDLEQWSQDNAKLHRIICEYAQMPLALNIMDQVLDHWHRLRRRYLEAVFAKQIVMAQQEHWQLLAVLRTRSPERVAAVIREHNRRTVAGYISYLTQAGRLDGHSLPVPAAR